MNQTSASKIKLRPVLTLEDLQTIQESLTKTNPASKTLAVINLYLYKQGLGLIKELPTMDSPKPTKLTPEEEQEELAKAAEALANLAKNL